MVCRKERGCLHDRVVVRASDCLEEPRHGRAHHTDCPRYCHPVFALRDEFHQSPLRL